MGEMDKMKQFVTFELDDQRYALFLSSVERIVRIVEITPLPRAPEIVLGVVNAGKEMGIPVGQRVNFENF